MPIYTYRCENCGVLLEKTQKFSDPVLTRCPECGKKSLHKVYTPVGIVFKGSGFYATDHRSSSGQTHFSSKSEDSSEPKETAKTAAEAKKAVDSAASSKKSTE